MPDKLHPLLDWRAWRRREDRRQALVIVIFLVIVGGIAIGIVYGWRIAIPGMIGLLAGAIVFGLLWLILALAERWAGHE